MNDDINAEQRVALRCINFAIEALCNAELAIDEGNPDEALDHIRQVMQRLLTCRNAIK